MCLFTLFLLAVLAAPAVGQIEAFPFIDTNINNITIDNITDNITDINNNLSVPESVTLLLALLALTAVPLRVPRG